MTSASSPTPGAVGAPIHVDLGDTVRKLEPALRSPARVVDDGAAHGIVMMPWTAPPPTAPIFQPTISPADPPAAVHAAASAATTSAPPDLLLSSLRVEDMSDGKISDTMPGLERLGSLCMNFEQ
jgi:hypothetical protein